MLNSIDSKFDQPLSGAKKFLQEAGFSFKKTFAFKEKDKTTPQIKKKFFSFG